MRRQVQRSAAAERLRTLPGINWVLAYTILAEVGEIKRFRSYRQLAAYSLVAPRSHESAQDGDEGAPLGRHVGHAGRRTLKWAWVEAAHGAVRSGGRFRAIFDRRTNSGRRDRNRGYLAVAHELCKLGYVLWSRGVSYRDTPPPRPGTRIESSTSRPEVSQPEHSMVAAE